MQFETDRGALGSTVISQISAGRKNRLWLEVDGAEESLAFDQEEPETLWVGRREAATLIKRDPAFLSGPPPALARLPAGHPQGYARLLRRVRRRGLRRDRAATRRRTACRGFADGLRAARITDAVLTSAREERWVDVPAHEPLEVAR